MPLILLAGTVTAKPKIMDFPASGRPRIELRIEAEGDSGAILFRVIAHDDLMAEAELLMPGDAVSICGSLQIESRNGQMADGKPCLTEAMASGGRFRTLLAQWQAETGAACDLPP
jgi:hypothetical protein